MTNPELIARMRSVLTFKDLRLCPTALRRIETLEAKLAKVEAGLRDIAAECGCSIARATLAEISSEAALNKGESHE